MVQQFHPDKGGEPDRGGFFEELIAIGRDVELAQVFREVGAEECWLEGDRVD